MENKKILSVVIPTYNRAEILLYTLSLFEEQIQRNRDEAELIVCDNASIDNTVELIDSYAENHPFVHFIKYPEHADVGDSITRSIENASGKFFIVFGDDDLPAPFMVDMLLCELKKHPDVGMLVFNRMGADATENINLLESLYVEGTSVICKYEEYYVNIKEFANRYINQAGFISNDVIKTEAWLNNYKKYYPNNHMGWNYMVPYFYSARNYSAIYYQFPLCIRRRPARNGNNGKHAWNDKWGIYIFIGKARLLAAMESIGLLDNWREVFQDYIGDEKELYKKLCRATSSNTTLVPYIDELCASQIDKNRIKMIKRLVLGSTHTKMFWSEYYKRVLFGLFPKFIRRVKRMFHLT